MKGGKGGEKEGSRRGSEGVGERRKGRKKNSEGEGWREREECIIKWEKRVG